MEVAEVGLRTRRRARAQGEAMAATSATSNSKLAKRRKLNRQEVRLSSSYIQLRNRTINTGTTTALESRWSRPRLEILDHDRVSTSCCSSNGSSETMEFVDLKEVEVETSTYYSCRESSTQYYTLYYFRREMTPSSAEAKAESADLDSKAQPSSEASSRHRSPVEKMPTDSEINDFFTEAEKNLLKKFSEKYNFDFSKEKPQEGRYEWVRLKP